MAPDPVAPFRRAARKATRPLQLVFEEDSDDDEQTGIRLLPIDRSLEGSESNEPGTLYVLHRRALDSPDDPVIETHEEYLEELDGVDPEVMSVLRAESAIDQRALGVPVDPLIEARVVFLDELEGVDLELMGVLEAECNRPASGPRDWEPLDVELRFEGPNNFFAGLSMDVSKGGLFVSTYQPSPIGTSLLLSIALPGGHTVTTPGVVAFHTEEGAGEDGDLPPGMGVSFVCLSAPELAAIRRFCKKRRPTYFETR